MNSKYQNLSESNENISKKTDSELNSFPKSEIIDITHPIKYKKPSENDSTPNLSQPLFFELQDFSSHFDPPSKIIRSHHVSAFLLKPFSYLNLILLIMHYILTDLKKKPRSFKIGVFAIFIVAGFLATLIGLNQMTPAIFLRLAESQTGDADLILSPILMENDIRLNQENFNKNPINLLRFLEGNKIEKECDNIDDIYGCSARWMFFGETINNKTGIGLKSIIFMVDSQKEISIGLGRNLKVEGLNKGQCYLTESTRKYLKVENEINLRINVFDSLISQNNLNLKDDVKKSSQSIKNMVKSMVKSNLNMYFPKNQTFSTANLTKINPLLSLVIKESYNSNEILDLIENSTYSDIIIDSFLDTFNLTINFEIKNKVKEPSGKWSSLMGNVLVFDYKYLLEFFFESFIQNLFSNFEKNSELFFLNPKFLIKTIFPDFSIEETIKQYVSKVDLKDFAMTENFVLKNKISIYSDEKTIDKKLVDFSNLLKRKLDKIQMTRGDSPLSVILKRVLLIKYFLDNIFASSVFLLLILSIVLIYSLMLSHSEEKTFEFGMLRALGFFKTRLIGLLLIQGLLYAIVGTILAFLFSFLLNAWLRYIIYDYTGLAEDYNLPMNAIICGILLGIIMPVISNILPIMRALSKNLKDSLDLYHRVINDFTVNISRLETLGISFSNIVNSLTLIFMGLLAYYFAPYSFLMQNIRLFLLIMNSILLIMLIGLTIFCNLFQKYLEKIILKIILLICFKDIKLEVVVKKNMMSHITRNTKTALMFTLTMSFLIFAGTGLKLQKNSISNTLRAQIGADMTVEEMPGSRKTLPENDLRNFLTNYSLLYPDHIEDYTFVSLPFNEIIGLSTPNISPLSRFPTKRISIKGIEENFLRTVYSQFYIPSSYDESINYKTLSTGQKDGVQALYEGIENVWRTKDKFGIISNMDIRNSSVPFQQEIIRVMLSEGSRYIIALDNDISGFLSLNSGKYQVKVGAMTCKLPGFGFFFSSYQKFSLLMVTSMKQFGYLMQKEWENSYNKEGISKFNKSLPFNLSYGIPKEKIFIKFQRKLTDLERLELANGLRNVIGDYTIILHDTNNMVNDSETALFYIDIFFVVISVIAVILSFFLILVSFYSNVRDNVWEFGILRSLGLNKLQMTRIYIYESLTLTISAGIIGTIVGTVIALILTVQYLTFAELPLQFEFPFLIFNIAFGCGVLTAGFASYFAVKEMRNLAISNIMKGLM